MKKCSNCDEEYDKKFRRCPHCGAKNADYKTEDSAPELKTKIEALENDIKILKEKHNAKADDDDKII